HAEVGVEVDARPRDVAVADAEVGRGAVARLHRAADAGAVYLIGVHVELVVVEDEAAGDAERPQGTEVEHGGQGREVQLAVVGDVGADFVVHLAARVSNARGYRRGEAPGDVGAKARRADARTDASRLGRAGSDQRKTDNRPFDLSHGDSMG